MGIVLKFLAQKESSDFLNDSIFLDEISIYNPEKCVLFILCLDFVRKEQYVSNSQEHYCPYGKAGGVGWGVRFYFLKNLSILCVCYFYGFQSHHLKMTVPRLKHTNKLLHAHQIQKTEHESCSQPCFLSSHPKENN